VERPSALWESLELSNDEIHELLPTALGRREEENRDDILPGDEDSDVAWDSSVRVY
jgi:hypothetical protein